MPAAWKETGELAYLDEVSSVPLQRAVRRLRTAFTGFFAERAQYPRFKSRKESGRSAECAASVFRFRDGKPTPARMAQPPDMVGSRALPPGVQASTVTVSQGAAGRWHVSLLCEDSGVRPFADSVNAVGVDAGLGHLLTLSARGEDQQLQARAARPRASGQGPAGIVPQGRG